MDIPLLIRAFSTLGQFLKQFGTVNPQPDTSLSVNELHYESMKEAIGKAEVLNGWFTAENIAYAMKGWSEALQEEKLEQWLKPYSLPAQNRQTIALILAGNIPMVGFHDVLCVLAAGHRAAVKLSSNDKVLIPAVVQVLEAIAPEFAGCVEFTSDRLPQHDAVIATGSGNTARYFEYYFRNKPNIIRKNRNSVAVITGRESEQMLEALGEDIFRYFGLGCRNVSKIFIPENYDLNKIFKALYPYRELLGIEKYTNNYDYNKAVYLMSLFDFLDNGFVMLKEDQSYASPIASLFYERYETEDGLRNKLHEDKEKLQCVVSDGFMEDEIRFGQTQKPELWDYADGVDVMQFLISLN